MADDQVAFASIMRVNNETGCIMPVNEAAEILRKKCPTALIHCDMVQAFGKLPLPDVDPVSYTHLDIVINEALNPDFVITGAPVVSKGTISLQTGTSFRWSIDQLGTTATESATVTFPVQHTAITTGTKNVNQSLTYSDNEGNTVSFSNPTVFVNCEPTFPADFCPEPVDLSLIHILRFAICSTVGSFPFSPISCSLACKAL